MDWKTSERNVTAGSVFRSILVDLQKFMFSDRNHLTASALARFSPTMRGLMLWITCFNRCSMYFLLLLFNDFLKVRAVYFKADSTISGVFQCSACSAGAPPTCTSSPSNFLGVEGPFSDEMSPSRVVWRYCCVLGCVGAFSQLLKYFSKSLAWLMVLLQWGHFSFLMGGSQLRLRKIWYNSCICVWFFQSNIPLVAQSVASPHQSL